MSDVILCRRNSTTIMCKFDRYLARLEIEIRIISSNSYKLKVQLFILETFVVYKEQESQLTAQIFAAKQRELSTHQVRYSCRSLFCQNQNNDLT